MSPDSLARLIALEALRKDFPKREPMQTVSFAMSVGPGISGGQPFPQQPRFGGWEFTRSNQLGQPIRVLRVTESYVTFTVQDYSRWKNVWSDCRRYFDAVLQLLLADAGVQIAIKAMSLQCTDAFIWKDPNGPMAVSECLKVNKYIAEHGLSAPDLWHSHHGFFVPLQDQWALRRLDNINVDLLPFNNEPSVFINMGHRTISHFEAGNPPPDTVNQNRYAAERLEDFFVQMHLADKAMLHEILQPERARDIGLTIS